MAYSIQRATSDGTLVLLDISIDYLDREEIAVLFDGVVNARQWAWVGSTDKKISFTPAVDNGVEVSIVRTTDLESVRHIFTDGAKFITQSMDENFQQILHIAQEARENATIEDVFKNLNMHGYRIINIGDGIDPRDAPSMAQMVVHDAVIVTYRDAAAASAAAALVSENAAAASAANAASAATSAITAHKAAVDEHAISGVTGLTAALAAKQATLVSGTNIKTVNGASIIGSGDLSLVVADGNKGDITVSGGGTVFTIDQKLTLGNAQATTSGTSKDHTGIPSWVKRVTVMLYGVSTNGVSPPIIRLGAGGVVTTGYYVTTSSLSTAVVSNTFTDGFALTPGANAASNTFYGELELNRVGGNIWVASGGFAIPGAAQVEVSGGITLSGALDQIRLTTQGGTDTFDAGTWNINYE